MPRPASICPSRTGRGLGHVGSVRRRPAPVPIGIAELGTAFFVARSQGAQSGRRDEPLANAPFVFYLEEVHRYSRTSPISREQHECEVRYTTFPARSRNPPARRRPDMWPAFAQAVGLDVDAVEFVNISPQAKVADHGAPARSTSFPTSYNGHDLNAGRPSGR